MILAVTGHRPDKLGGYSDAAADRLTEFAVRELERISEVQRPAMVLTGMALGWDQSVAAACFELAIPFHACIPCDGQESRWPDKSQRRYRWLLDQAAKVEVVTPGPYAAWKMQNRNEYMTLNCDRLLALWDGSAGGTANCVRFASELIVPKIEIENCWQRWVEFRG